MKTKKYKLTNHVKTIMTEMIFGTKSALQAILVLKTPSLKTPLESQLLRILKKHTDEIEQISQEITPRFLRTILRIIIMGSKHVASKSKAMRKDYNS